MFLLLNISKSQCSYFWVCSFKVFLINKTWYSLPAYHQFHNVIQDWNNFAWIPNIWWLRICWKENRVDRTPAQNTWSYQHSVIFRDDCKVYGQPAIKSYFLCCNKWESKISVTYLVNKRRGIYLYPKFTMPLTINLSKSWKWSTLDFSFPIV